MIDMKEVRIRIDENLWAKIKSQAALEEKHVKDYAADLLEESLEDHHENEQAEG